MAKQRNLRNTSLYTVYLKGQGIDKDGRPLTAKEKPLTEDQVRIECAEVIAAKLSEAYASIEVAKELGIFDENFADTVINSAKDGKNLHSYRKPYFKKDIYKKINDALEKAGKEKVKEMAEVMEEQSEFK